MTVGELGRRMEDEVDAAMWTGDDGTASRAVEEAGVAAAVEQEDGLFAAFEGSAEIGFHFAREHMDAFSGEVFVAHVNEVDARHGQTADARGHADQVVVFFFTDVFPRFERGRGGAEDDGDVFEVGALHGDIAGVIARSGLVFVAGLGFFVDDDDAEIGARREDGAARADDDGDAAGGDGGPGPGAFDGRQAAVQRSDAVEASFETANGLRREGDFGDEHDGLATQGECLADGTDVDFGLSAAGYPKEKPDGEGSGFDGGVDLSDGGGLVGRQIEWGVVTGTGRQWRLDGFRNGFDLNEALFGEGGEHGGGAVGDFTEIGGAKAAICFMKMFDDGGLLGGPFQI